MGDRLFTSKFSESVLNALRYETKLEFNVLARMAFFLSLAEEGKKVQESYDFGGKEIKRPTFIASDETFLKAIISYVYKKPDLDEDEFYSTKSIIKNHIDNGCLILESIYNESDKDVNTFLTRLAAMAKERIPQKFYRKSLDILVGKQELTNEKVIIELNNTQKHANSHLAIMGKPGVGKTQLLLKILADIRKQSNFQTNFIFFDYKGDVVSDNKFTEVTKATTYILPTTSLPVNPFILPRYNKEAIMLSAREKSESFASINSKFGIVQKGNLTKAISTAYEKRKALGLKYPDFKEVFEIVRQIYEEEDKKDDTLIQILKDLSDFNLFWEHGSSIKPIEKLTEKTMIIDLHKLPVLKELVAYLVIERLYKEMSTLPDSVIVDGRRNIRTILVIDEAHNYLPQKNIFLQRIIREGRSKGIFVFFASQSPNDYAQKFFNFQELLEFSFVFQCEGVTQKTIQELFGCKSKKAKNLQVEVSRLKPFQVISKGFQQAEDFIKFEAEAFYKSY